MIAQFDFWSYNNRLGAFELTEQVQREDDARQAEAFKEAQDAEHGHVDGEGHAQAKR